MKNSLFLLLISLSVFSCNRPFEVVRNGESEFVIIIPQDAGRHDSTAAKYLSTYLRVMTGAAIPVLSDAEPAGRYEFCLGNTNRLNSGPPVAPDAYSIITEGQKVHIYGGEGKGVIYGTIELLERWGCRKFSPTEANIPHYDRLTMDRLNVHRSPKNHLRILNGRMTQDPEFADWLRIATIPEVAPPGYYVHTFERLLPREVYFDAHPEYYAWLGNKYSFDQPCPSNPSVKEIILERLSEEMENFPDFNIWSVSQNDNFTYCRCEKCQAVIDEEGSPAGPVIRLVNDVAVHYPEKTIATLAYQFSRPAPAVTPPEENVLVRLCTIELNRSIPIREDSASRSFVKDISDWAKICDNIYLWDYTINFNHSVSPFPNLHVLQPNMQFFYENNARMQFPQTNLQAGHEFAELKGKLLSALMWDPYVNTDSVKNDFFEQYYFEAGPYLKAYAQRLEDELLRSGRILYIYEPHNNHSDGYLSAGNIIEYNRLFDEAEHAVAHRPDILRRVKVSRLPLQYAMMEIAKNDMFGARGWYSEEKGQFILRDEMKETLESFFRVCQENNIESLNERHLTPEIYYNSTLRFIDVKVEGNLAFRRPVSVSPPAAEKYAGGDPMVLTDGVQGAHDFAVHWLGWWGEDAAITVDLEQNATADSIGIGSLWDGRSWILHPASVSCFISTDGSDYTAIGISRVSGDQQEEAISRKHLFFPGKNIFRYIRFEITGAGPLPRWHASEGEPSWFFVDEVSVY